MSSANGAFTMVTDEGRVLHLWLDPPVVVQRECMLAVQRWRWRRIEKAFPQLAANGIGKGGDDGAALAAHQLESQQ